MIWYAYVSYTILRNLIGKASKNMVKNRRNVECYTDWVFDSACSNNWGWLKGPGYRLKSPENRINKRQNKLWLLNLNLDIAKILSSVWWRDVLTSFFFFFFFWWYIGKKLTCKTRFEPIMRVWKSIKNAH